MFVCDESSNVFNTLLAREPAAAATANTISVGCVSSIYRLHLSKAFRRIALLSCLDAQCLSYRAICCLVQLFVLIQ